MPEHKDFRPLDVQAWEVTGLKMMHCNCRGCKGKLDDVIKTIRGCKGVDYITTDAVEQKVFISANVASAKVLLKKLLKSRKHTQLCQLDQNFYFLDNGQPEENTLFSDWKIRFKLETLVAATGNFHDDNKLGEGASGTVYKGTHDGKQIAVKKLDSSSMQGKEFLNEVEVLSKIQHRNLVKLLAWCQEGSEKLIVYEYLPNTSLDKFLDDAEKRKHLDWQKRYHIILGVSHGLFYIHEGTQEHIVHRDIKPSNILLDKKLEPKIGDWGTARLFPEDKTHFTTGAVGTAVYMAPEYLLEGRLSEKADVYSFGIVLLQLVTGRKIGEPSQEFILKWVWRLYEQEEFMRMIDPAIAISGTCDEEEASRCIRIGILCTQADSNRRPSMREVYSMLSIPSMPVPAPSGIPAYLNPDEFITKTVSRRTLDPQNGHVTAMKWKLEGKLATL